MTKVKEALVLGKFLDAHVGHKYVIECAKDLAEHVTVLICEGVGDRTTVPRRIEWMKKTFGKSITIHVVNCLEEGLPEDGESNRDISLVWANWLDNSYPSLNLVVGSERYIQYMQEYSRVFQGHIVDEQRLKYPCSSTALDSGDNEHYRMYEGKVTETVKYALIGPESCGKSQALVSLTTLGHTVQEQARMIMHVEEGYSYTDLDRFALVQTIAVLDALKISKGKVLISDSSAITTWVYSLAEFGDVSDIVNSLAKHENIDHYLLFTPEVPFVQDGTRVQEMQKQREHWYDLASKVLKVMDKKFTVISGTSYDERLQQVKDIINGR
jgi:HTH-type transcriptional repressor of NAD biosynthesis genes